MNEEYPKVLHLQGQEDRRIGSRGSYRSCHVESLGRKFILEVGHYCHMEIWRSLRMFHAVELRKSVDERNDRY